MHCTPVRLPNGTRAIVCGARPRRKRCSCCGQLSAERLCDWKLNHAQVTHAKTCDKPICSRCSTVPAPDKDLCREHGEAWGGVMAEAA